MEWGLAVGEARAESLVGDAGEALVGVAGESSESDVGTPGNGMAHRGRLLVMLTPLPAASLTACLASSLRSLYSKL